MIRKTPFNDPDKKTIGSELRREFGWVIEGTENKFKNVVAHYPKVIFAGMSIVLFISFILRFTVYNASTEEANKPVIGPALKQLRQHSIDTVSATVDELQMIEELQIGVADRLSKLHLTREDSLYILKAEEIIKQFYNEKH